MARYEMGAEMASMAEAKPTPENFFELGMIYSAGREVDADLVAAHKWFNIAAVKGNREAALYRQEVAREMTAGRRRSAARRARVAEQALIANGFPRASAPLKTGTAIPALHLSVVVARDAHGLGDVLVFDRRLQHHALGELVDHAALDLLPGRLALRDREAALGG